MELVLCWLSRCACRSSNPPMVVAEGLDVVGVRLVHRVER